MKAVKCPYCGGPTKRNGKTSSGTPEVEVRRVRRFGHSALRRRGRPLRRIPVVASVEGHAARDARRRPDLQAQDRGVLGGLAHAGARRRVPPGPLRRRDLARGAPGRADLLQRGAGGLNLPRDTTTGGRNGAIGPFWKSSTAKTHSRSG